MDDIMAMYLDAKTAHKHAGPLGCKGGDGRFVPVGRRPMMMSAGQYAAEYEMQQMGFDLERKAGTCQMLRRWFRLRGRR